MKIKLPVFAERKIDGKEYVAYADVDKYISETDEHIKEQEEKIKLLLKKNDELDQRLRSYSENTDITELPLEPIAVAAMLINAKTEYEPSELQKAAIRLSGGTPGDTEEADRYSYDDLMQIAEHLMIYCKYSKQNEG